MADATDGTHVGRRPISSSVKPAREERVLALEIRLSNFGFVVFDGPTKLLDWRVRNYAGRSDTRRAILEKRLHPLLDLYVPSTVLMRRKGGSSKRARKIILSVVQTIEAITKTRSIQFQILNTRAIRSIFLDYGCMTKHQIASVIATRFEELSWKLPRQRKPWEREPHFMPIFDAVATGMAFFDQRVRRERKPISL
jgi:hypothetical protein